MANDKNFEKRLQKLETSVTEISRQLKQINLKKTQDNVTSLKKQSDMQAKSIREMNSIHIKGMQSQEKQMKQLAESILKEQHRAK